MTVFDFETRVKGKWRKTLLRQAKSRVLAKNGYPFLIPEGTTTVLRHVLRQEVPLEAVQAGGRKRDIHGRQRFSAWLIHAACKTPSASEKQILFKAGLGLKKIKLDLEDDEQTVIDKITSGTQDATGNSVGFPQLKTCGGFELMRCSSNCRDLSTISCSWNAKDLRSSLGGGQGKIYLRPIQKSLSTQPLVQQSMCEVKEKCYMCNQEVLVRKLRDHLWSCTEGLDSDDDNLIPGNNATTTEGPSNSLATTSAELSINAGPVATTFPNTTLSSPSASSDPVDPPSTSLQSSSNPPTTSQQSSSDIPSTSQRQSSSNSPSSSQQSSSFPVRLPTTSQQSSADIPSTSQRSSSDPPTTSHQTSGAPSAVQTVDLTQTPDGEANSHPGETLDEVVNGTVTFCKENSVASYVEILRCFQQKMVIGRALEVQNVSQAIEGETNFINVDRHNLMETGFEEIMFLEEYRRTLEVQFYGEVCFINIS